MIHKTNELIEELIEYTTSHINYARSLMNKQEAELCYKKNERSWSVLECLEHLNRYAVFYNNEIKRKINNKPTVKNNIFKSGFWGNKFALDMLPKESMKKMKTFKSKNPIYTNLLKGEVLNNFINHQKELLLLVKMCEHKDLESIKTSLTIPVIKFRLGDTLRFVIYHNERHIAQAKRACL